MARVAAFTKKKVGRFFDILHPALKSIKFRADRIFNCDETGVTVVQHAPEKVSYPLLFFFSTDHNLYLISFFLSQVLSAKGKKKVQKLKSEEHGSLITLVTCMSASGIHIPLMMIFPRKNENKAFGDGAPPGSLIEFSLSGWISGPLFAKWFAHFTNYINASEENPAVLIFDGHYSHTGNIDIIELAHQKHIILVCLPRHMSDRLQPLDVAFMRPFKTYYSSAIENWLDAREGHKVTHYQIAGLVCEAFDKAATILVAKNGFRATGIFPFNRDIFPEHKYADDVDKDSDSAAAGPSADELMPIPSTSMQHSLADEPMQLVFPGNENPNCNIEPPPSTPCRSESLTTLVSPEDIRPILPSLANVHLREKHKQRSFQVRLIKENSKLKRKRKRRKQQKKSCH